MNKVYLILATLVITAITSCDNNDTSPQFPAGSNEQINSWIFNNMNGLYLWTDEMPKNTPLNQHPIAYFQGLKFSGDRFSIIVESAQALENALNGVSTGETGYRARFIRNADDPDQYEGVVMYVKNNTPSRSAGLRRGDVITHINNSRLNQSNVSELSRKVSTDHTIRFKRFDFSDSTYTDMGQLSLTAITHSENPNFLDTVYTLPSNKKVGYFVYHFFAQGVDDNRYDDEMDAIFGNFKAQGIDELIVDLRYNGGGFVSSATNLASLIGRNVNEDDNFFSREFYPTFRDEYVRQQGSASLSQKFFSKAENIGGTLSSGNVYFIVERGTASASELVINGLLPYMNPILIGQTTIGKNVGSILLKEDDNDLNNYGLLPIVLRLNNANGNSDYENGFEPDFQVTDFTPPLRPFGDINETMLSKTLAVIEGENVLSSNARIVAEAKDQPLSIGSSQPMIDDLFP